MSLTEGLVIANGNLPDESGYYIICIRNDENLPESMKQLGYHKFNNYSILYSGITTSIRNRETNHFRGSARNSTLRKSIGHLLGYMKELLPAGKYRFIKSDETKLSNWMRDNLIMYCSKKGSNLNIIETELIDEFNPPLNIKGNFNSGNIEFRRMLSELREEK